MTQENKTPLCYAPFVGLFATGYGDYAPCCVSDKTMLDVTAEQYWTSDELKTIRSELLNGRWPSGCSLCKKNFSKGITSEIDFWYKFYNRNASGLEIDIDTGNRMAHPLYIDYRPTNQCNLKCRMCVPNASSQIEQEINENPELSVWRRSKNRKLKYIEELTDYIGGVELNTIKILGGEPTMDPNVISLLENIITTAEKNNHELPVLRFTTNGTTLNKRFRKILEKFKSIRVCYSVDAVGHTYNYIRTNANWNVTKKQIEENFKTRLTDASVSGFNVVLMPYNQYSFNELLDWFYDLYNNGYKDFYIDFYDSDINYTSMSAILPDDMNNFICRTEEWIDNCDDNEFIKKIVKLIPLLQSVKYDENNYKQFVKYSKQLDVVRKTSLLHLDDRFEKYI